VHLVGLYYKNTDKDYSLLAVKPVFFRKTNRFSLYIQVSAVYYENQYDQIRTYCGKNVAFWC